MGRGDRRKCKCCRKLFRPDGEAWAQDKSLPTPEVGRNFVILLEAPQFLAGKRRPCLPQWNLDDSPGCNLYGSSVDTVAYAAFGAP
jgi:hypothetical protein